MAFLFWPDSTEAQARNNLRQTLHLLKHTLPDADHFLHSDGQTVQWLPDAPFTLDVAEFEEAIKQAESVTTLQHAVSLCSGELLPGCYDDWLLPERERLQQQFIETLDRLIRLLEKQHEYRSAIQHAERLLRADPLREETYQQLIHLHALSGNRTGALRVYRTCVTVLKRELDAEPSPETQAVYEESQKIEASSARPRQSPRPRTNNLPAYLTSFIGRKEELERLKSLFPWQDASPSRPRLMTLTGAGGCGKTRLAIELATQLLETFPDGVWFVDLAPLTNSVLVPQAIAAVLDVQEQSGRTLLDTLSGYLQSKQLLLILDNCEHLVTACAQVVQSLLHACPHLRVMATSSEKLNVMGEMAWLVSPLSLPDVNDQPSDTASRSDAVHLFVERACSVLPTLALNAGNAAAIVQVCQHLDGIPLAIELAAARVAMLTPAQIAARLTDIFQVLARSGYTTRPHHQTLRATIDWSYDLLSQKERVLFHRLAVFAGGFTLEAVEQVCTDQVEQGDIPRSAVLDLLSRLIDKSLVMVMEWKSEQMRYRLLEPIRQYAFDRLIQSGKDEQVRERHLDYFLELTEDIEAQLRGPAQLLSLRRLEIENDNLRAALAWSQTSNNGAEKGLRLTGQLGWFWQQREHVSEGRQWVERALAHADVMLDGKSTDASTEASTRQIAYQAKALCTAGQLAWVQGDYAVARSRLEASLKLWRELGTAGKLGTAEALTYLALTSINQGDLVAGRTLVEESLTLLRSVGDKWGLAAALGILASLVSMQGEYTNAHTWAEESEALLREVGDRWVLSVTLTSLGECKLQIGDYDGAGSKFKEALAIARESGTKAFIANALNNLGEASRCQVDYTGAALFYEESLTLYRELGAKSDIARLLHNLGCVAWFEGDLPRAERLFVESLSIFRQIGNKRGVAEGLTGLAGVAVAKEYLEHAARLLGAAEGLLNVVAGKWFPADQVEYDRLVAALHGQMAEPTFFVAWAEGRAMTMNEAIDYAMKAGEH